MAGPIIRQGVVQLGVELKVSRLSAAPIEAALVQQQKAAAAATREAAKAAEAAAESLNLQRAAEEKAIEAEAHAVDMAKIVASEKSIAAKQAKALADAVEIEASSVAISGTAAAVAAEQAEELATAHLKAAEAYQKASVGALRMTRGFILLAGSENESISKAIKHIFVVQGLMDVSKGAIIIQKNLAKAYYAHATAAAAAGLATGRLATAMGVLWAATGPVAVAIAVIASVIERAIKVWDALTVSEEEAADAAEKAKQQAEEWAAAYASVTEQIRARNDAEQEWISQLNTAAEKELAYTNIIRDQVSAQEDAAAAMQGGFESHEGGEATIDRALAGLERQKAARQELIELATDEADKAKKRIGDQKELIELREREFQVAKDALKVEEDKSRALRAQIGALNQGEQRKLKRLLEAADSGALSRKQALDLQKLGGKAGQDIAEVFLAQMDKGLGDLAEKTRAKITGEDSRSDAQAEFQRREAALNKETGGATAEAKLAELQTQFDDQNTLLQEFGDKQRDVIRDLISEMNDLRQQQLKQRESARTSRNRAGQ